MGQIVQLLGPNVILSLWSVVEEEFRSDTEETTNTKSCLPNVTKQSKCIEENGLKVIKVKVCTE